MTAHQSKGLEFDIVIMANMRHGHWDARRAPVSVSVPEDLLFGWESQQRQFERTQDERRVAYVAMTRARHELVFTCPKQLASGDRLRDVSPSLFVAEAKNVVEIEAEVENAETASTLLRSPVIDMDEAMKAFLLQRLEHYALSATGLNRFLEDPQLFLQLDLLAIPQAKELTFAYGNAVHHTLNKWALLHQKGEEMSESAFLEFFRRHLQEKELLTTAECERLIQLGSAALPRYYQDRLAGSQAVIHKVESTIVTQLGDARLKGKLDRIDLQAPDSAVATVIDYKTGKPKTEKECVDYGYVRQLTFYALLLEHGAAYLSPQSYILDFIGEREHPPLARPFQISDDAKKELTQIIAAVWQKILALDFSPL